MHPDVERRLAAAAEHQVGDREPGGGGTGEQVLGAVADALFRPLIRSPRASDAFDAPELDPCRQVDVGGPERVGVRPVEVVQERP